MNKLLANFFIILMCETFIIVFGVSPVQAHTIKFKGEIVFSSEGPKPQIMLLDGATGKVSQLTNTGMNLHPKWSPDGKKIAFASALRGGHTKYEVYIMDTDGENQNRIIYNKTSNDPHWYSNNKLFFSGPGEEEEMINLKTDKIYTISSSGSLERLSAYDIDKFIKEIEKGRIKNVKEDVGELSKAVKDTIKRSHEIFAIFPSPNGRYWILYYKLAAKRILLNTYTGHTKDLNADFSSEPAWSKDSRKVAYSMGDPGEDVLMVYDVDNDKYQRIRWHKGKNILCGGNLSWSEDSNEIAYACGPTEHLEERTSGSYLYIYSFKTKKSIRLVSGNEPDWH